MKLKCALVVLCSISAAIAEIPPAPRFSVEHMDRSVEPGKDFYRYANGNWEKKNSIPPDQVTWSPTTQLIERNWAILKEIVESAAQPRAERSPEEVLVGDLYASAMDEKRIEELGFKPIAADLERIDQLGSINDLATIAADLHERGIAPLFDVSVSPDAKRSTIYAVEFTQGGISLPDRDYYFGDQFRKERGAFHSHIGRMLELLGTPQEKIAPQVTAIIEIETALAKDSRRMEDLSDPITNYHKLGLVELEALAPRFAWRRFLELSKAAPTDYVVVGQPEFFETLNRLLGERPLDDWKAYLKWHVLTAAAPLLHKAAQDESFDFNGRTLNGQPELDPRWKRAIRRVDHNIGEALGKIYVKEHFPEPARVRMREMVDNLSAVYRDRLAKVSWMSDSTREEAVKKFDRFTAKIGAPEKFRDYTGLEIRRDDFVGNLERAAAFESRRQMARVGKRVDRTEWEMTPPTVNAYFNPLINEIVFPAGILQPPFFDLEMDDAVNYGATGATIGHEMTHGYDSEGRKFDAEGNLRDWWKKSDAKQFEQRAAKLEKQFNAYKPLPGLHVNGKLTLAENIADLGGLSIAYEALQRALAKDPAKRKEIDGFTPEQRFFISYAQSWASLEREEYVRRALTTDSHAPDRIRAYAPLTNLQEFFDAFGIKKGAPLWRAPEQRAVIW